ncbi:hypothetical protein GO495_31455 [Chitinophaga oryziterrae]|uniref:tRNA nuclease CdiA C-terminal domain-containing protein n=1 Tax=Chitinophaga oryziterrae TaxID=1031224 RepID=A0A6N8JIT4_9BACT|nr:RHS repeat-associated core domain-containing protein [Chitinophaga oryziterrae]MVT45147.1 hypothetical protein [Chitinophaga oryziterrae]
MATVSDKKTSIFTGSVFDHYEADIVSAQEYYPFGMQMPGRGFSSGKYRYGFNGKENDNEVKGEGNQQDYGMRVYDSRSGKFLSVDPLTKDFAWYTPYQFAGNTPIQAIDLDGAEQWIELQASALKRKAEIKMAQADKVASESTRLPEGHILLADIYGNGYMGPASVVRERVAYIKNQHDAAVGESIAKGPFGALGYKLSGDNGAIKWGAVDDIALSLGGIPEKNSSVFPERVNVEPTPFVSRVQAPRIGTLRIEEGGQFSESEINAAKYMKGLGYDVLLRSPKGTRAQGGTSDLVVDGTNYDVFTPKSDKVNNIITNMRKKNSQTTGIVLDLSQTTVTAEDLGGNVLQRVRSTAKNIKDIVILPKNAKN